MVRLHLPAVCKVKTTLLHRNRMNVTLHLPAVCKVKTTGWLKIWFTAKLHLPAVCKVKTTVISHSTKYISCICLLFAR